MLLIRAKCVLFACLLALSSAVADELPSSSLQLSVWGGGHRAMLDHAVMAPFATLTGVNIQSRERQGTELGSVAEPYDVIELELHEAIEACDKGELSLLPGSDLSDFVPNTLQPCAIGQYIWSTVFAFDRNTYKEDNRPSLISDFFNVGHYPGRRAVRRSPRVLSEWALLAAGVPATAVYETLAQADRAWQIVERVLEPIAHLIVWVDDDEQALQMLRDGTVSFAMVGSDALIRSVIAGADNLIPVWDGAVNQMSLWGIPPHSSDPELAWQFVRYATSVDATRRFSTVSGYGPSRYSTLEQISAAYHQYLPTNRTNLSNVIWGNSSWWRGSGKALDLYFVNWLSSQFIKSDS